MQVAEMINRESRYYRSKESRTRKPEADYRIIANSVSLTANATRDTRHGDKKGMKRSANQ